MSQRRLRAERADVFGSSDRVDVQALCLPPSNVRRWSEDLGYSFCRLHAITKLALTLMPDCVSTLTAYYETARSRVPLARVALARRAWVQARISVDSLAPLDAKRAERALVAIRAARAELVG